MDDAPPESPHRNGAGDAAVVLGAPAVVFSAMPFVGEFISAPAALGAVTLGLLGARRVERGEATNPIAALVGAALGLVAIFITFVTLAAGGTLG